MKIKIRDGIKIATVQKQFSHAFPFLKLEFFSRVQRPGTRDAHQQLQPATALLGQCRKIHADGEISIVPGMTVRELTQCFMHHYGLLVQVWRKSGNVWIETNVTGKWTLEEQNRQGEEMSKTGYWKKDA